MCLKLNYSRWREPNAREQSKPPSIKNICIIEENGMKLPHTANQFKSPSCATLSSSFVVRCCLWFLPTVSFCHCAATVGYLCWEENLKEAGNKWTQEARNQSIISHIIMILWLCVDGLSSPLVPYSFQSQHLVSRWCCSFAPDDEWKRSSVRPSREWDLSIKRFERPIKTISRSLAAHVKLTSSAHRIRVACFFPFLLALRGDSADDAAAEAGVIEYWWNNRIMRYFVDYRLPMIYNWLTPSGVSQ